jgi:drug/metabolite transporter (DMT)-like permease
MVTAAATVWGLNGTVSKLLIQDGFDPPQLTTLRATGAFVGLLVLVLMTRGPGALAAGGREMPDVRRASFAEVGRLTSYGLIGVFSVPLLYFVAISRLPVGIGLLFEFTAPAFVALWVRFGEHQQVRRRLWFGLVLCLVGLVSVAQLWTVFEAGRGLRLDGLGILAGLAAAVLLAVWYVLGAKLVAGTTAVGSTTTGPAVPGRDTPPPVTRDPLTLTCWAFGAATLAGAAVRPWWSFDVDLLRGHSGGQPTWLLIAYLIVFGTILPYLLITSAMRHLPPTSVGIIGMVEILLASLFAWVLLGEALNPAQILGGLVLIAGVAIAESARVTAARPDRTSPGRGAAGVEDPRSEPPTVPAGR